MALPDYFKREQGTAVVWGTSGGTGVTANLGLNNLSNNAGRMGVSVDLGAQWEEEHAVSVTVESGATPAAGNVVEVYFASSRDNSEWPGRVTGSDAAYPATVDDNKKQLGNPVSLFIATAAGNTIQRQNDVIWRPPNRYVAPVVINTLGVSIRNLGTPASNASRVILTPTRLLVQDSA